MKKILNGFVGLMSFPIALLAFHLPSDAAALKGGASYFYQLSEGKVSPIFLNLDSRPVSTGEITYSLDISDPESQTFAFDFDTKTVNVEIDYLLDFPLLRQLGRPPIKLNLSEVGTIKSEIPNLTAGKAQNLTFQAQVIGVGSTEAGSFFSGLSYNNTNDLIVSTLVDVEDDGSFSPTQNTLSNINVFNISSTLSFPGNTTQTARGIGRSILGTFPIGSNRAFVFEPRFSLVNFLSICVILFFYRRNKDAF